MKVGVIRKSFVVNIAYSQCIAKFLLLDAADSDLSLWNDVMIVDRVASFLCEMLSDTQYILHSNSYY